jgi:hypothetical protein
MLEKSCFQNSGMDKYTILLACLIFIFSCQNPKAELTYKIVKSENGGFGYMIFQKQKRIIDQPFIPCIKSIRGFATEKDAEKIGKLVIWKIEKGERPPSITEKELDSLKIVR